MLDGSDSSIRVDHATNYRHHLADVAAMTRLLRWSPASANYRSAQPEERTSPSRQRNNFCLILQCEPAQRLFNRSRCHSSCRCHFHFPFRRHCHCRCPLPRRKSLQVYLVTWATLIEIEKRQETRQHTEHSPPHG